MTKTKFQVDVEQKDLERYVRTLEKAGAEDITPLLMLKKGIIKCPLAYTIHFTDDRMNWKECVAGIYN